MKSNPLIMEEQKEKNNSESKLVNSEEKDRKNFQDVMSFIETTDLDYVQIEKEGKKIFLRKASQNLPLSNSFEQVESSKKNEPEAPKLCSIRSPIVGRFYIAAGADRPPFVVESGRVNAGQKVGIVEAMKIKKEVFSACEGRVSRILVRDGDPVEYGQELIIVEPTDSE